jgi:hypothetical protein
MLEEGVGVFRVVKKLSSSIPHIFKVIHNEGISRCFRLEYNRFECYRVGVFLDINSYRFDKK